MKKLLYLVIFSIAPTVILIAHPGIGIVCDANNNIYYSDLENVWMIDSTGNRTLVVPSVHAHELVLDAKGNVYGEHYWYDDNQEEFKHYLWKLTPGEEFLIVRDTLSGENLDFSFVRDQQFRGFTITCVDEDCKIERADKQGKNTTLYTGKFENIRWQYLHHDGDLYFVDLYSLYKLTPGNRPRMLIEDLHENRFPFSFVGNRHNVYGVWADQDRNLYCAIYGGRMVKKITNYGEASNLVKSNFIWSPINGVFDHNGDMWLMEATLWGKVRVRKIELDRLTTYNTVANVIDYFVLAIVLFLLGYMMVKIRQIQKVRQQSKKPPKV